VWYFVENFSRRIGKPISEVPEQTLAAFEAYDWPGNIRELQNLIERAIILSDNGVLPNPLPSSPPPGDVIRVTSAQRTLKSSERDLILQTLRSAGWVIGGDRGAAAKLGVKRTTLIAKMKKLGISRPMPSSDLEEISESPPEGNWGPVIQ
jgi:transcriptional regulator with PAS, ATPase and Fis domain